MGFLKIYGHSDDLIEIEGDIEDEIGCFDSDVEIIASDGTILFAHYGSPELGGVWKISVEKLGVGTKMTHTPAVDEDGDYSDIVTVTNEAFAKIHAAGRLIKKKREQ